MRLGATPLPEGRCEFCLWAPRAARVELHVISPREQWVELRRDDLGYFSATVSNVEPGALYRVRLDGDAELPDPASRSQPQGVHGPSEVIDLAFPFTDAGFPGRPLVDYVTYELHVGTFTSEGSFEAVIEELPRLRELGINAVELMPVAQFPGERNWGYDGVHPFAVQRSYGGARGLQALCNACHAQGLSVVLDVVYNHLGPEGNYLHAFGPYFTEAYKTPWGAALNFDDRGSDEVRRYFIENALQWVEDFHVDALRLDAVHAIMDRAATTFLEELGDAVHAASQRVKRPLHVIAESDLNDPRLVRPRARGGYALDSMWSDDFHHALHALLTGEHTGYYADFGRVQDLALAWRDGMTYAGRYSAFRGRRHGRAAEELSPERFVVCAQNHDQVGNRMFGERLSALVGHESLKLAAACTLLSPHLPLLFMGEEYGEEAPFLYFVSHGDAELIEAVRRGRRQEFASFGWSKEPPDPQSPETFGRSRLDRALRTQARHAQLESLYRDLILLRRQLEPGRVEVRVDEDARVLEVWSRDREQGSVYWLVLSFSADVERYELRPPYGSPASFRKRLSSAEDTYGGPGDALPEHITDCTAVELPALTCVVYLAD